MNLIQLEPWQKDGLSDCLDDGIKAALVVVQWWDEVSKYPQVALFVIPVQPSLRW